jgi:tetratricopeptide (TPR) repeat protein
MDVRYTKAWKTARWEYKELNTNTLTPLFGIQLSPEEIIERLDMTIKGCPKFYPALLDLALRRLALGGGSMLVEQQIEEGFHLMLELAKTEHIDEEINNFLDNLENLWRFDLSRYYLDILIERYPHNALFHDSLAYATARMGEVGRALLHIKKAINLEPDNHYFKANQVWLNLMAGNLKEASEMLESALLLDPNNEEVKGNLDTHKYLTKHGGNYFDYLLRPVEKEMIEQLWDEEDWDELDRLCDLYNADRFEAFTQNFLQNKKDEISRLPDMLAALKEFFRFVRKLHQEVHLNEDIDFIHEYFKPIMHKFIFKFGDIDQEIIEGIYIALLEYYGFLASMGLQSTMEFNRFQKNILGMKKELIDKMQRYNAIRHRNDMDEDEKEAIRDELFDGDHAWPFL